MLLALPALAALASQPEHQQTRTAGLVEVAGAVEKPAVVAEAGVVAPVAAEPEAAAEAEAVVVVGPEEPVGFVTDQIGCTSNPAHLGARPIQ